MEIEKFKITVDCHHFQFLKIPLKPDHVESTLNLFEYSVVNYEDLITKKWCALSYMFHKFN